MEITKSDIENVYGGPFIDYALQKIESYGCHYTSRMEWDEIKRLAQLGATLEKKMREVAEDDDGHHAHLTFRCFATGNHECEEKDWYWYVWRSQDADEPVRNSQLGSTAQQGLDNWTTP